MSDKTSPGPSQERYARQLLLPQIGEEGQKRLKTATVAIVGLGGLGSPVAMYLAAAGVGALVLIDGDIVSWTNLNRQLLHAEPDIGKRKTDSAQEKIRALNHTIELRVHSERLTTENAEEILKGADAIVDCLDSLKSRQDLMRASWKLGIPLIHAAVRGFEGRLTVVVPRETACLGCWLPNADSGEAIPVIGPTPGVMGALQASETLKFLLGIPPLLTGRVLMYDGLTMQFRQIAVEPDPDCPVCGSSKQRI